MAANMAEERRDASQVSQDVGTVLTVMEVSI